MKLTENNEEEETIEEELTLEEVMKKNAENKERVKADRDKANNSVTRSYGLKR